MSFKKSMIVFAVITLLTIPAWSIEPAGQSGSSKTEQNVREQRSEGWPRVSEDSVGQPPLLNMAPNPTSIGLGARVMRFIASGWNNEAVDLFPMDVEIDETMETPALVSLTIPRAPARRHLMLCSNSFHRWLQVPSGVPLKFRGSYRFDMFSDVLPSPGVVSVGLGIDGILEFEPSQVTVERRYDPAGCMTLDVDLLGALLESDSLPLDEAKELARQLLASNMTIEMILVVKSQSVGFFTVFNALLSVYGD